MMIRMLPFLIRPRMAMVRTIVPVLLGSCLFTGCSSQSSYRPNPIYTRIRQDQQHRIEELTHRAPPVDNDSTYYHNPNIRNYTTTRQRPSTRTARSMMPPPEDNDATYYYNYSAPDEDNPLPAVKPAVKKPAPVKSSTNQRPIPADNDTDYAPVVPEDNDSTYSQPFGVGGEEEYLKLMFD